MAANHFCGIAHAQDFNNIEYLCCDWGPAMTLPAKTNEVAQFNDAEDEIYFLKQITSFTRKKRVSKELFSGRDYEDIGKGLSIYLCKMKADGSDKIEIKELWKNPAYPIDTQTQSTWMSVNTKTRMIAFSITYAGSDITGLWTLKLDGTGLKRIIEPRLVEERKQAINHPCWTPDGSHIVYEEGLRGTHPRRARIASCDTMGASRIYLTAGPEDRQPNLSPDGKQIAYIHWEGWASLLWIMKVDGSNAHPLPNPDDKRKGRHGGTYPAWSPEGRQIFAMSAGIVAVASGKQIKYGKPMIQDIPELQGKNANVVMPHWGRAGLLCGGWGGGIQLADEKLEKLWILATSDNEMAKK